MGWLRPTLGLKLDGYGPHLRLPLAYSVFAYHALIMGLQWPFEGPYPPIAR